MDNQKLRIKIISIECINVDRQMVEDTDLEKICSLTSLGYHRCRVKREGESEYMLRKPITKMTYFDETGNIKEIDVSAKIRKYYGFSKVCPACLEMFKQDIKSGNVCFDKDFNLYP